MSRDSRKSPPGTRLPALLIAAGAVLLLIAGFAALRNLAAPSAVRDAPKLSVDQDEVDLGDVQLGQTVEVSFDLTNTGDRTLQFTEKPYVEVVEGC